MRILKGYTKTVVIALVLYFLGITAMREELEQLGVLSFPIFGLICAFLGAFCHDD